MRDADVVSVKNMFGALPVLAQNWSQAMWSFIAVVTAVPVRKPKMPGIKMVSS